MSYNTLQHSLWISRGSNRIRLPTASGESGSLRSLVAHKDVPFPRLDQLPHFHYDAVDLKEIEVSGSYVVVFWLDITRRFIFVEFSSIHGVNYLHSDET